MQLTVVKVCTVELLIQGSVGSANISCLSRMNMSPTVLNSPADR